MTDIIIGLILFLVLGLSTIYVVRAKRNGQKCIGCPHSKECSGGCKCNTRQ